MNCKSFSVCVGFRLRYTLFFFFRVGRETGHGTEMFRNVISRPEWVAETETEPENQFLGSVWDNKMNLVLLGSARRRLRRRRSRRPLIDGQVAGTQGRALDFGASQTDQKGLQSMVRILIESKESQGIELFSDHRLEV